MRSCQRSEARAAAAVDSIDREVEVAKERAQEAAAEYEDLRGSAAERCPLVQLAFHAFATREHSLNTLGDLLEEAGLRTRPTQKRPTKPMSRNALAIARRATTRRGIAPAITRPAAVASD